MILSFALALFAAQSPTTVPLSGPRAILSTRTGEERALALADLEHADFHALGTALVRFDGIVRAAGLKPGDQLVEVSLARNDRLVGLFARGAGEKIVVQIAPEIEVEVALDEISALRRPARLTGTGATPEPAAEGDRLYRAQGDGLEKIDGAVEAFTTEGVRFHGTLVGSLSIPWSEVGALFVEHLDEKKSTAAAGTEIVLDVAGDSRLSGRLDHIDATSLRLRRGESVIAVPLALVELMQIDDGALVFVSQLTPKEALPARPFGDDLGMVWPHRVDRSVDGGPLTVSGRRHPRGLGMHAGGRLVYALDGQYTRLRGLLGVDDSALRLVRRGSVVFRVLVDGKKAYESAVLHGGEAPATLALDVTGAHEIALEIDPTSDGFSGDRADWLDLVLERAPGQDAGGSKR